MSLMQRVAARMALAMGQRTLDTPCPTPEDIVAWHEGALHGAQAKHVREHVAHCPDCYALWSGLVSLEAAEPASSPATGRGRVGWRWWVAWPAFALGVLGVAIVPSLLNQSEPGGGMVAYELSVQGGLQARGADDAPITLADGSALEIVLMPASATEATVHVGLFAETPGAATRLDVPVEVSPKGVAVIDVIVGEEVSVPAATQALIVVASDSNTLPGGSELLQLAGSASPLIGDGWRAWRIEVGPRDPGTPD